MAFIQFLRPLPPQTKPFYTPPQQYTSSGQSERRFLSFKNEVTAFDVGRLPGRQTDVIFVGSPTGISAFDPETNSYIFSKEIPQGVSSIVAGSPSLFPDTAIITGGSCCLQGFSADGEETFWTVASDDVTVVTLISSGTSDEILAGTADGFIRLYSGADVVFEVQETSKIIALSPLSTEGSIKFSFALENGIVGNQGKHPAQSLTSFDYDESGNDDVVIGWSHGKIEIRVGSSGSLLFKDNLDLPLSCILYTDFASNGKPQLLALSSTGKIKGFSFGNDDVEGKDAKEMTKEFNKLLEQKQELLSGITLMEKTLLANKKRKGGRFVPADAKFEFKLKYDANKLWFSVENESLFVFSVIITADQPIFDGETVLVETSVHPATFISTILKIPVPQKSIMLSVEVVVAPTPVDTDFFVFEQDVELPEFFYLNPLEISSNLNFSKNDFVAFADVGHISRLIHFIKSSFGPYTFDQSSERQKSFESLVFPKEGGNFAAFTNAFDPSHPIVFNFSLSESLVYIYSNSMEICSNIIQAMGKSLEILELNTLCHFDSEFSSLSEHLSLITEANVHRSRMNTDSADGISNIKSLLVKAEDNRLQHQYHECGIAYHDLFSFNHQLLGELNNRIENFEMLMGSLKYVNSLIQRASKLRLGRYKTSLVDTCRKAIRNGQISSLRKIIAGK
ncbi:hypothetical protein GEMRC1_005168 [Eukaryota sp. GEM-RC1]